MFLSNAEKEGKGNPGDGPVLFVGLSSCLSPLPPQHRGPLLPRPRRKLVSLLRLHTPNPRAPPPPRGGQVAGTARPSLGRVPGWAWARSKTAAAERTGHGTAGSRSAPGSGLRAQGRAACRAPAALAWDLSGTAGVWLSPEAAGSRQGGWVSGSLEAEPRRGGKTHGFRENGCGPGAGSCKWTWGGGGVRGGASARTGSRVLPSMAPHRPMRPFCLWWGQPRKSRRIPGGRWRAWVTLSWRKS